MPIKQLFLALCICVGICLPARTQPVSVGPGFYGSSAAPYIGPGDIVSGAKMWWGLRAYNAAYATAHGNIAIIRRQSDNATMTITALSSGKFDLATAVAFAGTDATGTGSISGTTLTFTGGHGSSTITGTGVAPGTKIIGGASPTWTVNISQTVASTTMTLTYGMLVTTLYDQTGNGNNLTNSTASQQPQIMPNYLANGLPVFDFQRPGQNGVLTNTTIANYAQPITVSYIAIRTGNFSNQNTVVDVEGNGGTQDGFFYSKSDGLPRIHCANRYRNGCRLAYRTDSLQRRIVTYVCRWSGHCHQPRHKWVG
jgi:hypothetical protein